MQACGARANSMQTVAEAGNSFLSSHRCYKGTALNKTMLLQDLLYFFFFLSRNTETPGPGANSLFQLCDPKHSSNLSEPLISP